MDFFKKNYGIILIILLGAFLRIVCDTFIKGYIFDEIAIVSVAKTAFPFEILKNCAKLDYHAPLYYFICHFFMNLENEWLYLRLFNLILSLINIYVFYQIGKILKDKSTGLVLALALAVNHMHISTVSFVKFYCIDFLLVSLSIYYFIKVIKKNKGMVKLGITNFFLNFGWTFSFVFTFFEYLILFFIKPLRKNLLKSFLIAFLGFLIYLPVFIFQIKNSFENIISPHGVYPDISPFGLYAVINDYFSPLLNYNCALETVESNVLVIQFLKKIIELHQFDFISFFAFVFLSLIPVLIGIFGVYYAIKKDNAIRKIAILAGFFAIFFILLIKFEITGLISVYLFTCGLCLIICAFFGLKSIKNKKLSVFLIFCMIVPQIIVPSYYPIEKREPVKQRTYHGLIQYSKEYNKDTILVMSLAGRFLKLYLNENTIFDFDYEGVAGSFGRKYIEKIYGKNIAQKVNKKNYKSVFSEVILNNKKTDDLEKYLDKNLFSKMKKGDKLVYIFFADDCAFIADRRTTEKVLKDKRYNYHLENSSLTYQLFKPDTENASETFVEDIVRSYSNKLFVEELEKKLKRVNVKQYRINDKQNYNLAFSSDNFPKSTLWIMENVLYGWVFVTYQKE